MCLDRSNIFLWHIWLADAVKSYGHELYVCQCEVSVKWPTSLITLLALERLIYRLPNENALSLADISAENLKRVTDLPSNVPFDAIINCTGTFDGLPSSTRILTPIFDSLPTELGAWDALLDGRNVNVGVIEEANSRRLLLQGTVALENPGVISTSLNNICSRTGEMILKALHFNPSNHAPTTKILKLRDSDLLELPAKAALSVAISVARKAIKRLTSILSSRPKWAVGWRNCPSIAMVEDKRSEAHSFRFLDDDGSRYYADPFTFQHSGQNYIFVEEFPFATGKGVVSVCEIGQDDSISVPRIVLEEPHHLSYPMVFEDDDQIWMIPESGEGRTITLYRAQDFPRKWVRECDLLQGLQGYDATLHRNAEGYWLFVTTRIWKSTTWDSLSIFYSNKLRGPWLHHSNNPVLLDARASRSAGSIFKIGSDVYRPAQYSSVSYGEAITICRIESLSQEEFTQRPVGLISAKGAGKTLGTHTYNRGSDIEVIDVFGEFDGSFQPSLKCEKLRIDIDAYGNSGDFYATKVRR